MRDAINTTICSALPCSIKLSISLNKVEESPFDGAHNNLGNKRGTTTEVHRTSKRDQHNLHPPPSPDTSTLCVCPFSRLREAIMVFEDPLGQWTVSLVTVAVAAKCSLWYSLVQFGSVRFWVHYFVVAIKVICHICRRPLGAIKAQSEHFLCLPDAPHSPFSIPILENQFKERKSYQSFWCTNPFY